MVKDVVVGFEDSVGQPVVTDELPYVLSRGGGPTGYHNGDEVLTCEGTGILPVILKTQASGNAKRGLVTVADVIYDAENYRYTCPAGQFLIRGKRR